MQPLPVLGKQKFRRCPALTARAKSPSFSPLRRIKGSSAMPRIKSGSPKDYSDHIAWVQHFIHYLDI